MKSQESKIVVISVNRLYTCAGDKISGKGDLGYMALKL